MTRDVELARQQWDEGRRRLQDLVRDSVAHERALGQVEAVTDELRRRVGATYTLVELARAYAASERWAWDAIEERAGGAGWSRTASLAVDASFHLYARGATDYAP